MSARPLPALPDTVERIVLRLARLARGVVTMGGRPVLPAPPQSVYISAALLRKFVCAPGCAACCATRVTIDYTPAEYAELMRQAGPGPDLAGQIMRRRRVEICGREFDVMSYNQSQDRRCQFLAPSAERGGLACSLWPRQPLECAAAPQLTIRARGAGTAITKLPFSRPHLMGEPPQCQFDDCPDPRSVPDASGEEVIGNEIALLRRYLHWAEYLGIDTCLPDVISAAENLPRLVRQSGARQVCVFDREREREYL